VDTVYTAHFTAFFFWGGGVFFRTRCINETAKARQGPQINCWGTR